MKEGAGESPPLPCLQRGDASHAYCETSIALAKAWFLISPR